MKTKKPYNAIASQVVPSNAAASQVVPYTAYSATCRGSKKMLFTTLGTLGHMRMYLSK